MSQDLKNNPIPTKMSAATKLESLTITTDGTMAGTTIVVNGVAVNPESFCFQFYNTEYSKGVRFDWSEEEKDRIAGDVCERNYYSYVPIQASQHVPMTAGHLFKTDATQVNPSVVIGGGRRFSQIGTIDQSK